MIQAKPAKNKLPLQGLCSLFGIFIALLLCQPTTGLSAVARNGSEEIEEISKCDLKFDIDAYAYGSFSQGNAELYCPILPGKEARPKYEPLKIFIYFASNSKRVVGSIPNLPANTLAEDLMGTYLVANEEEPLPTSLSLELRRDIDNQQLRVVMDNDKEEDPRFSGSLWFFTKPLRSSSIDEFITREAIPEVERIFGQRQFAEFDDGHKTAIN